MAGCGAANPGRSRLSGGLLSRMQKILASAASRLKGGCGQNWPPHICLFLLFATAAFAQGSDAESVFESQVRPLLVKRCVACHSAKLRSGGLALDSREAWLKGGDSGTPAAQAVVKA